MGEMMIIITPEFHASTLSPWTIVQFIIRIIQSPPERHSIRFVGPVPDLN